MGSSAAARESLRTRNCALGPTSEGQHLQEARYSTNSVLRINVLGMSVERVDGGAEGADAGDDKSSLV
jgi:hypothetical protein